MKKKLVFKSGTWQTRIPLLATLTWWMLLDYTNQPGWVWGMMGTFVALVWILYIMSFFNEEVIDINDETAPEKLRKWADRLEALKKKHA